MNETLRTLCDRVSVRSFLPDQITRAELDAVLEAGKNAPTGMNRQSPVFIAVQDKTLRDRLSALNAEAAGINGDPFYGAPTVICVVVKNGIHTNTEDGSLAIGNMLNAAFSLGLGSCWIHRCREMLCTDYGRELLETLGLSDYTGVGCCILGYPKDGFPPKKERKQDYVRYLV